MLQCHSMASLAFCFCLLFNRCYTGGLAKRGLMYASFRLALVLNVSAHLLYTTHFDSRVGVHESPN